MPYLMVQTNIEVADNDTPALLKALSSAVSQALGKSENYVMIALEAETTMLFAGNDAPTAYLELKSLGLPEDKTALLSDALCTTIEEMLRISKDRIYIEFAAPDRHMWGWNGKTF